MAEEGVSILETESYVLAVVFLVFLAVFTVAEKLLEWRQANLTRRRKVGLLAALNAVKSELMLFGVASLLLNVLETPITSICIPVRSTSRWTILSQLNGCECCLAHTKSISECFLDYAGCGADFCNCNNADPTCLETEANNSEAAATECAGIATYSTEECGNRPGYKQALTSQTITQIHTILFYIAVGHILCSVIMSRIATARIQIWKKWLSDDDVHCTAVNATLQQFADAALQKERSSNESRTPGQTEPNLSVWQSLARSLSKTSKKANFPELAGALPAEQDTMDACEVSDECKGRDTGASHVRSEHTADGPQVALPHSEVEVCLAEEAADEVAEDASAREHSDVAVDIHLPDEVVVEHSKRWAGRKGQLDKRRHYIWEWVKCFLRQFRVHTIQHAEISIMKASFILTHRPGKKFKFMDYILASLDDDVAKVVGLGWTVWLVVIVFILLAGVMGWAAAWFELLAVILELVMNTKLIYIARHTARGGRVHRLKPSIFWFGANGPWVMLLVIKTLLFLISFIFASLVFFAVNFGPKSCFFATPGLNAASLPIPWWVILIVNVVVYLVLSFVTLPLYSLGVQMGSGFRPHIMTPNVKNRLLDIAQANKEKVRQRKLEEGRGSKYKAKFRRLSGRVSGSGQRWRRNHLTSRSA